MPVILFVDDEPGVLDGLRRQLRRYRDVWDMRFVEGGEAALAALAERPAEVLVTDVRMPGMDGLALMREAREHYPDMTRIVLSGYAPPAEEREVFQVAHRVLPKPCEHERLVGTLQQALALRKLLGDPGVIRVVGSVERLPSVPKVYSELVSVLDDPESDAHAVARIIERDPTLVASVLRVANSAAVVTAEPVTRVRDAVTYLGRRMISSMVLGVAMLDQFEGLGVPQQHLRRFQVDAMASANLASRLADRRDRDDAFASGMLHDIGQLVLFSAHGPSYAALVEEGHRSGRGLVAVEQERLGAAHDRVGAYLLGLWGLPYTVVTAVAWHHASNPEAVPADDAVARALRCAVKIIERAEAGHPVTPAELAAWPISEGERARAEAWLRESLPRRNPVTSTSAPVRPMTYRSQRRI